MTVNERLADFVKWLGTMPREKHYNYGSVVNCALAQYGQAVKPKWLPSITRAGDRYFSLWPWSIRVEIIPDGHGTRSAIHQLMACQTLGELHDRLAAL